MENSLAGVKVDFQLHILCREEAEALRLEETFIVLSITDPGSPAANLVGATQKRCLGVHRVSFWDVDRTIRTETRDVKPMASEEAVAIARFLERYIREVRHVVVHCEAGISRSAGAAAAIAMHYLGDDWDIWQRADLMPNVHVYRYLLYALKGRLR